VKAFFRDEDVNTALMTIATGKSACFQWIHAQNVDGDL